MMTKPRLFTFAALLVAGCAGFLFWQQQGLRRLRADNARLLANATELDSLREEVSRLRQTQADAAELERLRQTQAELLRLRGETSQLRRQLKEEQQARRAPAAKGSPPVPASTEETAPPVETFSATVRASLASKQTLVTGGWAVPNNKRALVLIEPAIGNDADQSGQVVIQTHFVEVPEEILSKIGLDWMKANAREHSAQSTLTAEQSEDLINTLKESRGVNFLSAPKISTLDGRQAQVKLGGTRTIDGNTFEVGPSIDIMPRVSQDDTSVDLTVIAQLRYQTPTAAR